MLRSPVHDRYFANRCDRVDSLICSVHCLCLSFISCSRCSIQLVIACILSLFSRYFFPLHATVYFLDCHIHISIIESYCLCSYVNEIFNEPSNSLNAVL
nr:hypothetical protein CFP56_02301 [Quercus suber]